MYKFNFKYSLTFLALIISFYSYGQSIKGLEEFDQEFMDSLPDEVRDDVIKEMKGNLEEENRQFQRRPSSKLSKLESVKEWERFKKKQSLDNQSERYGLRIFNSMQSSFMPINEPNFGNNYIIDYGDVLTIQLFGATNSLKNTNYRVEVQRDGSISLDEIGRLSVSGLNYEQVVDVIEKKFKYSFIGVDALVTLSEVRDINVLITGNVEFPGIYTLSGNSNILQALNISGGANENGSLRNIILKRKGVEDIKVDLYKALIFGDIDNIPFLLSGDSIHVEPVENLVRAGYGFNNTAVFEMRDNETIQDLLNFSGGMKIDADNKSLRLVRYENKTFKTYDIKAKDFSNFKISNMDSIYADKDDIGTITITGNIKFPGKYEISSSDKLLDIVQRSGGYTKSAYPFAASLYRKSNQELETLFIDKAYRSLINFIATNPGSISGSGSGNALGYLLSEIKNHKPLGRVIANFDIETLEDDIQSNIYLNDGDNIHIPSYDSNIYIFGEVGNPGSVLFDEDSTIKEYIEKSGGFTRFSSSESIFIVAPNGETRKAYINGIKQFKSPEYDIYPGSVIYIPRHIGKVDGINFYATVAPIFSSLALSIASLNSIKN